MRRDEPPGWLLDELASAGRENLDIDHVARYDQKEDARPDSEIALLASLGRRMPQGVTWTETQGGFSLLLELPEGVDAAALLPRALARGVTFTPGNAFFSDGGGERTLRLSFSAVPFAQIEEGVRRLGDSIREAQRHPERGTRERGPAVPLV